MKPKRTKEEKAAERLHRYHTDPEYRERVRARARESKRKRLANASPEELAEFKRKQNEFFRKWKSENADWVREYRLLKVYGITLDQFEDLLAGQDNRCAICRRTAPVGIGWHIDHDHATGDIRGILCSNCNIMIGSAGDRTEVLEAGIAFLKKAPTGLRVQDRQSPSLRRSWEREKTTKPAVDELVQARGEKS